MWIVYAFASALFAGLTAVLAKIGVKNVNSHLATALRTIVVALFAWIMVFLAGSQGTIREVEPRTWLFLILSGFATGASWICYFRALQIGSVNQVAPIDKSSTVLTMLLAFLFLHESLTLPKAAGMALMLAGTYLMLERKAAPADPPASQGRGWFFWAVLSAVFASLTSILGKVGIQGVESNLGTAIRTLVVLAMAWLIVLAQGKQSEIPAIEGRSWLFLVLSGFATGGSWLFYYRALQDGPASVVAPIDKLGILVTVAFSRIFLGEKLSRRAGLGLGLLTAGTLALLIR
ncbi:MAG: EamA family transporter [Lachnospirales bacterium]